MKSFRSLCLKLISNFVETAFYMFKGTLQSFWRTKKFWKQNLYFSSHCQILSQKVSAFRGKRISKVVKTAFYVSRGTFRRIFFKKFEFSNHSQTWSQKYNTRLCGKNDSAGLSELHFTCPKYLFEGFFETFPIWCFADIELNFLASRKYFSNSVVKTAV